MTKYIIIPLFVLITLTGFLTAPAANAQISVPDITTELPVINSPQSPQTPTEPVSTTQPNPDIQDNEPQADSAQNPTPANNNAEITTTENSSNNSEIRGPNSSNSSIVETSSPASSTPSSSNADSSNPFSIPSALASQSESFNYSTAEPLSPTISALLISIALLLALLGVAIIIMTPEFVQQCFAAVRMRATNFLGFSKS